jgi:hypothetical protein
MYLNDTGEFWGAEDSPQHPMSGVLRGVKGELGTRHCIGMQDEPKSTAARIINLTCLLCEPTLSCPT